MPPGKGATLTIDHYRETDAGQLARELLALACGVGAADGENAPHGRSRRADPDPLKRTALHLLVALADAAEHSTDPAGCSAHLEAAERAARALPGIIMRYRAEGRLDREASRLLLVEQERLSRAIERLRRADAVERSA